MAKHTYILGGGMTGIAAGFASGLPVLEAAESPGGICSSYYVRPREKERLPCSPKDGNAYRFEIGGGHWIFGGDPVVLRFIRNLTPVKSYSRKSSVYFREQDLYVPYPLQNHLRYLSKEVAGNALVEMAKPDGPRTTMKQWLETNFGPTLCRLFFYPFHELYTAGMQEVIAPQDAYKSPVSLPVAIQGAFRSPDAVGYNIQYLYPEDGLDTLARRMADRCNISFGKRVERIDVNRKKLVFGDGSQSDYDSLLSTLPLNKMMEMTELNVEAKPDPHTSVLVLNIGAIRGPKCPDDHWLYNPDAESKFHRVGFYSNVDRSFLPLKAREQGDRVSIYVEKGYPGGARPGEEETRAYANAVIEELQSWDFIGEVEVVDPTWIDVAYTWSWPGSEWKNRALPLLENHDIFQIGRYARWNFQGISDSIKDGFYAGCSFAS